MIQEIPLKTLHIAFVIFVITYFGVQLTKFFEYPSSSFINYYMNDLIAIPIVATISLYILWLIKKDYGIRLDVFSLASLLILYSVYFELYLPEYNSRYTGDVWDIICYLIGAVVFYILQKLP